MKWIVHIMYWHHPSSSLTTGANTDHNEKIEPVFATDELESDKENTDEIISQALHFFQVINKLSVQNDNF
jgi:hypothetical protein